MLEYGIIKAGVRHLPGIMALERECFNDPWPCETVIMQLTGTCREVYAANDGEGGMLGFLCLMYGAGEGHISNLAVSAPSRKLGIGSALVKSAIARSRVLGLTALFLEVRESNAAAIALYEKHGFVKSGRRKGYYENPPETAVLMNLEL